MHFEIRQNIPAYLADLNHWLAETRDDPLEEMSNFFTERVSTYEEHMARWNEAYRSMAERIPDNCGSLLDLGCGTGLELNAILKRFPGLHVTGIDLCEPMLAVLRQKHPSALLTLRCEDYFEAELGMEAFDTAISFESLHHFQPAKKEGLFRKLYQALKPGGLYLECDYIACCAQEERLLMYVCAQKRAREGIPEGLFVHFDTPLTLEHETELLERAGFQAVEALACFDGATLIQARKAE